MTVDYVRTLGEWDWWVFQRGNLLHAATVSTSDEYEPYGEGKTECGRSGWLSIPGMIYRMRVPRCGRCCAKLGYPNGMGSPKNDGQCRPLVTRRLLELRLKRY